MIDRLDPGVTGSGHVRTPVFEAWGRIVVRWPAQFIVLVLLVTMFLLLQTRHLRLSIDEKDQLPQSHPYVQLYNEINDRFGAGAVVVIGVHALTGDIFDPALLAKVERITRQLENLPELERGRVTSLASKDVTHSFYADDTIQVVPIMKDVPRTTTELDGLRDRIRREPIVHGLLVSNDATATAIVADLPVALVSSATVRKIAAIADQEADSHTKIVLGGAPVVVDAMEQYTAQMTFLFPLAVLVIGAVHYEAFRTLQALVLPLLTALFSVAWALGIMGFLRLPLDTWSAVTPIAILAVAAGHAVQILKRYYEELAILGDSRAAVASSVAKMGPVTFTATAIAASGFASLATFDITSVRVFALLMAFGILSTFVIEMTFVPACRAMLHAPRPRERSRERGSAWLNFLLESLSAFVLRRPRLVLLGMVAAIATAIPGAMLVQVDNSLSSLFPPQSRIHQDERTINGAFAGTSTTRLLVEGEYPGALEEPSVLDAVADLQRFLEAQDGVGATRSVVDYVEQMGELFEPDAHDRSDTMTREMVAQFLLIHSLGGSSGLSGFIDANHQNGNVVVYCRSDGATFARRLFQAVDVFATARFRGLPAKVKIGGGSLGAQAAMNEVVVREKTWNTFQVATIVLILSAVALRSPVGGVLVLLPLAVAALLTLAFMGWTGTWLSMSTSTVLAMGISIGADFAIYLIFRIAEELEQFDLRTSIGRSMSSSGKAVFFVASAVTLGYLTLVASGFRAWVYLGGLTALVVSLSAAATLILVPALVLVTRPGFLWRLSERMGTPAARLDGDATAAVKRATIER